MKTSELLVDIFIVGFLPLLWILGFTTSFIIEPKIIKSFLPHSSELIILIILSSSYCLGIIFDYINPAIFNKFKSTKEIEFYKTVSIIKIIHTDENVYKYIYNRYSRLKILRSIIINIPFLGIFISTFIYYNVATLKMHLCCTILLIILTSIIAFIISVISYKKNNAEYIDQVKVAMNL